MSVRDFSNDLHKSSRTVGLEQILNILQTLQKLTPKIEDDELIRFFMYSPEVNIHDTFTDIHNNHDLIHQQFNTHFTPKIYTKFVPPNPPQYTLTHTNENAAAIKYADDLLPGQRPSKYGAGAFTQGNSSISISGDNTIDKLSIVFWIYLPSYDLPHAAPLINRRNSTVDETFLIYLNTDQQNRFLIRFTEANGAICTLRASGQGGQWTHIAATFTANDKAKLYVNGIKIQEENSTSTLRQTTAPYRIFRHYNFIPANVGLAWLSIIHGDVSTVPNWITNDLNGSRDLDHNANAELEEITTIPFMHTLEPQPTRTPGLY